MGGCASKPKESDILEESAPVNPPADAVEAKTVETETVAEEKAEEGVVEKKEVPAGDEAEKEKEAEAAPDDVKPTQASEAVPADTTPKEASPVETEPPKEEATADKDDKTKEPLVTL